MIDWFYTFPELLLMILPATTLVVLLLGLSWTLRNVFRLVLTDTHIDFVMRVEGRHAIVPDTFQQVLARMDQRAE